MTENDFQRCFAIASDAITTIAPAKRAAVVVFHPDDVPAEHMLFSNAAAEHLLPVLKAVVARLEAGELRVPGAFGVHWVNGAG